MSYKYPIATATEPGSVTVSGAGSEVQSTNEKGLPNGYPYLDDEGQIPALFVPSWVYVTSTTLAMNGLVPTQRTFSDGSTRDYVYLVDGLTVDTVTVTLPSASSATYQSTYSANGIRLYWTLL